jgi:ribonuclease HI
MTFTLKFDGACEPNPGEMGIGVVVYNDQNEKILEFSEPCGAGTNIKAEYLAVVRGLERLAKIYHGPVLVQGDLQLVIKQLSNEWKVKKHDIRPLFDKVKDLETRFEFVEYRWVKREENKEADQLSAKALGLDLSKRDDTKLQLIPGHTYELVFDDDVLITVEKDERYGRDVTRYRIKSAFRDGKKVRGTYFETGSKRLIEKLAYYKPLSGKQMRIIPVKQQQKWTEYLVDCI